MTPYFIFSLLIILPIHLFASIPADISFIVIDLKYNQNDGVKVCEMQHGLGCAFEGVQFLEGKRNAFGTIFRDALVPYFQRNWYVRNHITSEFTRVFDRDAHWNKLKRFKDILKDSNSKKYVLKNVAHPTSLRSYYGLFVSHYNVVDLSALSKIKGLIVLNRAFFPIFGSDRFSDKLLMSELLMTDEELSMIKPAWQIYTKGSSQELIDQIHRDFSSDILVIKPRTGLQGRGIIILPKTDLKQTLEYIFSGDSKLSNDPDKAYNWWAQDKHSDFLIEEFIESDPVYAPHLSNDLYDGTMRVPVMLTYDNGQIEVHCLYMWWKLPPKSLNEEGTLTEKHKSFSQAPNTYVHVDQNVADKVREQLEEALPILYRQLL